MIIDFRTLESDKEIQADICIIGAGAAGITIAKSFINTGIHICLLESGGYDYESDIQDMYSSESIGVTDSIGLDALRLRHFGGTTNHWGGICGPLNEIDFEKRDWVPHSGWPIKKSDLDPYYERAHPLLQLGPYEYSIETLNNKGDLLPEVLPEKLVTRFFRVSESPTRFGEVYRKDLETAKNIDVYLYANVTSLEANEPASQVRTAQIKTLTGKSGSVKAKYFIVACGGIETVRLLLLSNSVEKYGLGNQNGQVGRYYGTHIHTISGNAISSDLSKLAYAYGYYKIANVGIKPKLCPSEKAQERQSILNCSTTIDSVEDRNTGFDILKQIKHDIANGKWPNEFGHKLEQIIDDFDFTAEQVYNEIQGNPPKPRIEKIHLETRSEQSPNPNSRIYLNSQKDQLGLNKITIDWQLTELDKRTVRVSNQLIAEEFGRLGLGRIKLHDWLLDEANIWPTDYMTSYGHHLGTARMSNDPKQGVVDKNCKVHSVSNLYIASGAVFPTSGYINPTLTIVALSLRLSDHLKNLFSESKA